MKRHHRSKAGAGEYSRGRSASPASSPAQAHSIRFDPQSWPSDDDSPKSPSGHFTEPVDPEIVPLVDALRADDHVVTKGSCCGHGRKPAYVDLAVEGMEGLRIFVARMNFVDRLVESEALLDVALNWSDEVVTACAFDIFPNWIMLTLTIEGAGRNGAPSTALLSKIAESWTTATTQA